MSTFRIGGIAEEIAASAVAQAKAGLLPPSGSTGTYTDAQGRTYTFVVDGRYPGNIRPGTVQLVSSAPTGPSILRRRVASSGTVDPCVALQNARARGQTAIIPSLEAKCAGSRSIVAADAPDILAGKPPPEESGLSPALIVGGALAALALGFVAYKTLA